MDLIKENKYLNEAVSCPLCLEEQGVRVFISPHSAMSNRFRLCFHCWNGWWLFENIWGNWIKHIYNQKLVYLINDGGEYPLVPLD